MTEQPLVSIIIPTYNRAELIGETLDSIIAQTYQNWECIVVDDGSSDNTDEVLKKYINKDSRIQYHHRPKQYKPGGNGARNYGFDLSKGEYINWFDSDDVMFPDFILHKLEQINESEMIICSHFITDNLLYPIEKKEVYLKKNLLEDYLVWDDNFNIVTNNVLFLKKYIDNSGVRFNEDILRGQETEFFLKLWSVHVIGDFKILNRPLFYYRQHNKSKSGENKDKLLKFNYSLCYVNFLKYKISVQYNFEKLVMDSKLRLKHITLKIIKDRDYKSTIFIVRKLLTEYSFKTFSLAISILVLFIINKTPKIILKKWDRI